MKTKTLKNGFQIPVVSYGTWPLGGISEAHSKGEDEAIQTIRYAFSLQKSAVPMQVTQRLKKQVKIVGKDSERIT